MAAPKGNKFWEARTKHGPPMKYSDPDVLWNACVEYFEWTEDNPLYESKAMNVGGQVEIVKIPKVRAMTITSLCRFLDVTLKTWVSYRETKDLLHIATRADNVIRDQKFTGAAADLLNANIIARDLGLSEKTDNQHTGDISFNTYFEPKPDER